jgi:hypothetical protein
MARLESLVGPEAPSPLNDYEVQRLARIEANRKRMGEQREASRPPLAGIIVCAARCTGLPCARRVLRFCRGRRPSWPCARCMSTLSAYRHRDGVSLGLSLRLARRLQTKPPSSSLPRVGLFCSPRFASLPATPFQRHSASWSPPAI